MGEIRLMCPETDSEAVRAVYAEHIDSNATFEYVLPDEDRYKERISAIAADYPFLVYTENGNIRGYAYAQRFRQRKAYDWCVELSVYISKLSKGKGVGTSLYKSVLSIIKEQNVQLAIGVITGDNVASTKMHEKLGFKYKGRMEKVGYKNGRWLDFVEYSLEIGDFKSPPPPFVPMRELDRKNVEELLEMFKQDED